MPWRNPFKGRQPGSAGSPAPQASQPTNQQSQQTGPNHAPDPNTGPLPGSTFQTVTSGSVTLVTLSPEWPDAPRYIEALTREGVVTSIGHTRATGAQIHDAVSAGATLSTHIGNGAHAVLARHPNYIWEQLAEDRLAASFIVDGIHLGDSFLRVALRAIEEIGRRWP